MKAAITGKGLVSPIGDGKEELLLPIADDGWFSAQKPNFSKYFEAKKARRTSKILKMGLVAAYDALGDDRTNLQGIIVGTGLGCVGDSGKFLTSLITYNETLLSPTSFIQSTHNTIAGSIALNLKIHQYNLTYSERIFSFEWSLLDALMQINESEDNLRFLVGSADEMTKNTFEIAKEISVYHEFEESSRDIVNKKSPRVTAGEMSCFFTLEQANNKDASLHFVKMYFQEKVADVLKNIFEELKNNGLESIDCILLGINGHQAYDKAYDEVIDAFKESDIAYFKHLCGESLTASSFGFWLANEILLKNEVPKCFCI